MGQSEVGLVTQRTGRVSKADMVHRSTMGRSSHSGLLLCKERRLDHWDLEMGMSQDTEGCICPMNSDTSSLDLIPGSPGILIRVLMDWASEEGVHWPEGASVCTSLVVNFSHANYRYTSISLILVNMTLPLEDGAFMPKKAHSDNQCCLVGLQMTSWSPAEGTTWKKTPAFFKCPRCTV